MENYLCKDKKELYENKQHQCSHFEQQLHRAIFKKNNIKVFPSFRITGSIRRCIIFLE